MLIILFGLSGSGKNFVANLLAEHFDYFHWDADLALPAEMKVKISEGELFTQTMRNELTQHIIDKIAILCREHEDIVISQALYKEQNRQQIQLAYPDAKLVQVSADPACIMSRLKQRNNEVTEKYAAKISEEFESSHPVDAVIFNNSDAKAVISQLECILNN